jgi:quinol monooxygenase YgiN
MAALEVIVSNPEISDNERCVITHVDFKPPFAEAGRDLLLRHSEALRSTPGLLRCYLLQAAERGNHFELVTVWETDEAYEAHRSLDETVAFRGEVFPMLGSPWDDRVHRLL